MCKDFAENWHESEAVRAASLGAVVAEPGQHVEDISFSPDGRLLATTKFGIDRLDPTDMVATIISQPRSRVR